MGLDHPERMDVGMSIEFFTATRQKGQGGAHSTSPIRGVVFEFEFARREIRIVGFPLLEHVSSIIIIIINFFFTQKMLLY